MQMDGNVQLVEFRLLFIQGDHVKKMLPEWQVPRLTLIDTNGWKKGILNHRIHILAIDSTLKKSVDQFGIKGDRNIGAILLA